MDALRSRLRAIREYMPQLGQLRITVLFDQPGDVVAAAPAAGLALDRERRHEEVRENFASPYFSISLATL
jgi:hypothetical protein